MIRSRGTDEEDGVTKQHLSLDDLRAAVFRHGDEDPAYTAAWTDDAHKVRVTEHLVACEICRDQVEAEREENDLYRIVCVERQATWDEVAYMVKVGNACATLEHETLAGIPDIVSIAAGYTDGVATIVVGVKRKTAEIEAAIPKSVDGISVVCTEMEVGKALAEEK